VSTKDRSTSVFSRSTLYSSPAESLTERDSGQSRSRRSPSIQKDMNYREHRYRDSRLRPPARDHGHRQTTRERFPSSRLHSQHVQHIWKN
jgi:hypothetical protein